MTASTLTTKMQLNFDAEKFIAAIKLKETIWNYKSYVYNDKEQRRKDWFSVCKEMVPNFDGKTVTAKHAIVNAFQRHWKVLRDGFVRSLKNMKKKGSIGKPYTYHNDLLFLLEVYGDESDKDPKQPQQDDTSDASDVEDMPDEVPILKRLRTKRKYVERRISEDIIEPKAPSPTLEDPLIEKIANYIEKEERSKHNSDNDEDKLFLLSLLTDFKSIPEGLKLDAKFDILKVLKHYRNVGTKASGVKTSPAKRARKSAAVSTTASKSTESCYVKCKDDDSEEDYLDTVTYCDL